MGWWMDLGKTISVRATGKVGDLSSLATELLKTTLLHDVRGFITHHFIGSSVTTAVFLKNMSNSRTKNCTGWVTGCCVY
jgi:hypothetical protein